MNKVYEGRWLNPGRALQIYEELDDPANRYYSSNEWGAPEEAHAQQVQVEDTICSPGVLSSKLFECLPDMFAAKKRQTVSIQQILRDVEVGFSSW